MDTINVSYPDLDRTHAPPQAASGSFDMPGLFDWLEAATTDAIDTLPYGVITLASDGTVENYNRAEADLTGLTPSRVIGRNFFTSVAPCTNNSMVAHRFGTEPAIDDVIDYVFTFVMAPQRVQLRLLKQPDSRRMYLAVQLRP